MKRFNYVLISALAAIMLACGTSSQVPITGRKHSLLVSDAQILSLSKQEYAKFLSSARLSSNAANTAMVKRVGQRLARAVETYLVNNGYQDEIRNFEWEFNLVADKQVNAFCMPGGKIVIYTGILPLCATDDELATVVSHEVSHAIARHSNERLSTEILRQMGGRVLVSAVGSTSAITNTVIQQAYGLGSQVLVSHPYSRKQEHEADQIGLVFMAMAGYNPEQAISFWKKMAQQGGGSTSELLSTHPSDANRIKAIGEYLPKALPYYQEYLAQQKVEQPKTPSTPAKDKKDTNRKPSNKKKSKKKSTKK